MAREALARSWGWVIAADARIDVPHACTIPPKALPRLLLVRVVRPMVWLFWLAVGSPPNTSRGSWLAATRCKVWTWVAPCVPGTLATSWGPWGGTDSLSGWSRTLVVPSGLTSRRASGSTLGHIRGLPRTRLCVGLLWGVGPPSRSDRLSLRPRCWTCFFRVRGLRM